MATKFDDEIKRKALAGIALTNPTEESQKLYDTYKAPQITTAPKTSNVQIQPNMLSEVERKANAGIPLTHYTPQKQELYNGYANPAPEYLTYKPKEAPTYNSKYRGNIDSVLSQLLNTQQFSYDANTDPLFAQYKESYNREGDRALTNAMAEATALSGGRGNSYAMTAGQQAQNYYNAQLNDKIPELQQLAYNMYNNERINKRSDIGMLQGLEDQSYGQYRGAMADYQDDRNFGYGQVQDQNNYNYNKFINQQQYNRGVIESDRNYDASIWAQNNSNAIDQRNFDYNKTRDAVGDSQWNKSFDRGVLESDRGFNYNAGRDAIGDTRYNQQWDYSVGRDAVGDNRWQQEFNYNKEQDKLKQSTPTAKTAKAPGIGYNKYYEEAKEILNDLKLTTPEAKEEAKKQVTNRIYRLVDDGQLTEEEGMALFNDLRIW